MKLRKQFKLIPAVIRSPFTRVVFFLLVTALVASYVVLSSSQARKSPRQLTTPATAAALASFSRNLASEAGLKLRDRASSFTNAGGFAASETITTFKADCTTPESRFNSGDIVCAEAGGILFGERRVYWVNPDRAVVQIDTVSNTNRTATRQVSQTGVWRVYLVDGTDGSARDFAAFSVSEPTHPTVDLSIFKSSSNSFDPGGLVNYQVIAINNGPDDAANATLVEPTPNNATLNSSGQDSGPTFTCSSASGTTTCTIASFPAGSVAVFTFSYQLDTGLTAGTTITNTTTLTSDTDELHAQDNSWTDSHLTTSTVASGNCQIACPEDVTVTADTTQGSQSGAIVHFTAPNATDDCGTVSIDHCNDCFFPEGTTVVTASAGDDSCSFRVIVGPPNAGAPTITCPGDVTANADNNCSATLTIGSPTVTGNNVTFSGVRSDGNSLYNCDCFPAPDDACDIHGACTRKSDAPFSAGTTTITWTAYSHDIPGPFGDPETEIAHRTGQVSCIQTIIVNDTQAPVIGATDQTVSADANCQATVPDYSSTVSDNCACDSSDTSEACVGHAHFTVTQTPAPGTIVGLGTHAVHITANDGSSNNGGAGNTSTKDITLTVADTTAPTFTFVPPAITAYTGSGATTCDTVVDPGTATATDNCSAVTITRSPSGNTFAVGTTTITWTATDGAGNHSSATQTITVIDNTPPTITTNGQTPSMWPPDHTLHTFQVTDFVTSVFDNCGGVNVSDVVISQVTSDELDDATGGGDGNTTNDIQIAANCKSVQLRSERAGSGDGRVYTITFRLTDTHGNVTTATAQVTVAHDQGAGPETVINSGVHYTVNSSCP